MGMILIPKFFRLEAVRDNSRQVDSILVAVIIDKDGSDRPERVKLYVLRLFLREDIGAYGLKCLVI